MAAGVLKGSKIVRYKGVVGNRNMQSLSAGFSGGGPSRYREIHSACVEYDL